jgi:hypothetical protein
MNKMYIGVAHFNGNGIYPPTELYVDLINHNHEPNVIQDAQFPQHLVLLGQMGDTLLKQYVTVENIDQFRFLRDHQISRYCSIGVLGFFNKDVLDNEAMDYTFATAGIMKEMCKIK